MLHFMITLACKKIKSLGSLLTDFLAVVYIAACL